MQAKAKFDLYFRFLISLPSEHKAFFDLALYFFKLGFNYALMQNPVGENLKSKIASQSNQNES